MIEWLIAFLVVIPALMLAFLRSSLLLDYAIIVLAFNRGLRRLVDYYINEEFNPLSPISLTPLVVAGLLILPALSHFSWLSRKARSPFMLLGTAMCVAFVVVFMLNRFAAVYSLAEWIAGLGAMVFAATQPVGQRVADRWIKTAGWCAVLVAVYGWWQYYTIPPWDAMWLVQSGMAGYMGIPEPTLMTVFSTLNERGPCGGFLAWAVIPMIISPRWRNAGGWFTVALLLSCIVLTETRSNLIIIGVIAVLYPALARGRGIGRLLVLTAIIVAGATWGLEHLPGMKRITTRFGSESLTGEGSSFQGRLINYEYGFGQVLRSPMGLGLGSSGMGQRAEGAEVQTLGDAGYIQIFAQFGWVGGGLFFLALWRLWSELSRRWKLSRITDEEWSGRVDPFIPATRAILIGALIFLFVGDIFAGFSLLWVFFGRSLSPVTDPAEMAGEISDDDAQDAPGCDEPAQALRAFH
jgi:hypothetical protein